jgi:hypothetical protein
MPNATDHKSSSITKRLLVGDSGVGKTTALAGLAQAGYHLHIYDFDNLLDPLIARLRREDAKALARIEFMSFRDKMKATPQGPTIDGQPTAFVDALRALDKWEDGSKPAEWGPNHIAVIDSLTTMSRAAYFWARGLQGAAGIAEGVAVRGIEPRNIFFTAQQAVMNCIALLTSVNFSTNILVIAHIKYMEQGGITKGFPLSVGTAISPEIPTYFPSVTLATKSGEKRILRTKSTSMIDLKDPRSFEYGDELPIEDLAKLFPKSA